ncbi:MAG TPA: ComEA family DNA-binding protein [Solirubrobacteraceae bacterium]
MPKVTLSRRRALVAVCGALAVVVGAAHFLLPPVPAPAPAQALAPPPSPSGVGTVAAPAGSLPAGGPPGAPATPPSSPAQVVVVDVAGAVRRPGLYRLPQGSRVADAIARAGGAARRADVALVNLAALLADGEQVLVPARAGPAAAGGAGAAPAPLAATGPVHLNSATVEQLDALPGVGPVTAQKIVDYRAAHGTFTSVDELDAIAGIGPAKIEDLRKLVAP